MAEVYRVYFPVVATVAKRGFGNFRGFFNPADRDDAIQNIFTVALGEKARLRYNGLDPYSSFLRGIAQNVCRRMLEKSARFKRTDGQPGLDEAMGRPGVVDQLIGAQEQAVIKRFVETVDTEPDKTILRTYFVDGQAEEMIAADIGITRYKVRKIIALLHRRMKRYLKDHGIG